MPSEAIFSNVFQQSEPSKFIRSQRAVRFFSTNQNQFNRDSDPFLTSCREVPEKQYLILIGRKIFLLC